MASSGASHRRREPKTTRRGRIPSPALLVAVIALVAAIAGTAVGGVAVTSLGKRDKREVRKIAKKLDRRAIRSIPAGPRGGPGPPGPPGSARAYGLVAEDGSLTRSRNVVAATHPDTGIYCIALDPEIDPEKAVLVVGPDSADNETSTGGEDQSFVEWNSEGTDCPAGALEVFTYLYDGDGVDDDDGGGNTAGDDLRSDDESFAFSVP